MLILNQKHCLLAYLAAEFVKYVIANPLITEYFEKQGIDASYKVCRPCNSDYFSLTAHWLSPPDFLLNGEISSLRSHYVTLLNHMDEDTGDVLVGTGKVARNKNVTIFDKYEQEYQETCRQS